MYLMGELTVTVYGSSGYVGSELQTLLNQHPGVTHVEVPGREASPSNLDAETAFLALPHGTSAAIAATLIEAGKKVIDLSGDFRLTTADEYERWYHQPHPAPELLPVPYALVEHNREKLKDTDLISVPGCYPTAALLSLLPLVKADLIEDESEINVKGLSGVSGMGKAKKAEADRIISQGNVVTYSVGRQHRHVGEMERFLGDGRINFTAAVGPFFRGMLVHSTATLIDSGCAEDVQEALHSAYTSSPLVHVMEQDELPDIARVVNTSSCLIGSVVVGKTIQLFASIDNLLKGGASQAVQAFNIGQGLPEELGLK